MHDRHIGGINPIILSYIYVLKFSYWMCSAVCIVCILSSVCLINLASLVGNGYVGLSLHLMLGRISNGNSYN